MPDDIVVATTTTGPEARIVYLAALRTGFWNYVDHEFSTRMDMFDRLDARDRRPPVFRTEAAKLNVLIPSDADDKTRDRIVSAICTRDRHRHFASMNSSQALAQSVFAGLAVGSA